MNIADGDCVILCGGLGTRLRPVMGDTPKVMAPVAGRPFLDMMLEHLKRQGAQHVVLCTGYQADLVESYYLTHDFGLTIDFSRENEPLGTGGALKYAHDVVESDPFFVFNGDSFLPVDLKAFLDFHKKKEALASILVSQVNKASDFGSLKLNRSDQIISFREKAGDAQGQLVNAGIYCFDRTIFRHMPSAEKFSLENDLFPNLVGKGFFGYRVEKEFIDIGTPERYRSAKENIKKGQDSEDRK